MDKSKPGIWITGASSGIGNAVAKEFASVGCNIFASARRTNELERLKEEIGDSQVEVYPCNVASQTNVSQTFKKISSEYSINCLVNNAGVTSFKTAEDNSIKEINEIINSNLLGSIYTIKSILPHFKKNGEGTIINVLSYATEKIFTNSSLKNPSWNCSSFEFLMFSCLSEFPK